MGILRNFERRLEGAVEGLFARAFRSGVQPVELGKRLRREMEGQKAVGVNRIFVPNAYVFELSERDRARFESFESALVAELAGAAVEKARTENWAMHGPVHVEFVTSPDLIEGRFRVHGSVEAGPRGQSQEPASEPAGPMTAMLPGEVRGRRIRAPASLSVVAGSRKGEGFFALDQGETKIGRGEHADITLPDPGISRIHARVVQEGDDFVVEDLGSTNGTEVNGQLVQRRRLADGDRVRVGSSTLQFRREQS